MLKYWSTTVLGWGHLVAKLWQNYRSRSGLIGFPLASDSSGSD
jgi:hypothetical protein